jgi:hypothetical protein
MKDTKGIEKILDSICDSIIKIGLVIFLHHNPGALDTAEGLSRWLGKTEREVQPALDELVNVGIVEVFGEGPSSIYSYTQDEYILQVIDQFISGLSRENGTLNKAMSLLGGEK